MRVSCVHHMCTTPSGWIVLLPALATIVTRHLLRRDISFVRQHGHVLSALPTIRDSRESDIQVESETTPRRARREAAFSANRILPVTRLTSNLRATAGLWLSPSSLPPTTSPS